MATWRTIASSEVDADSPVTATLMTALKDNPVAISEGATDAPPVLAGWVPYNMAAVGDGNLGVIYDFAVDGAVASVETPNFADGYEYRLLFLNVSAATGSVDFRLELYRETTAAYDTATAMFTGGLAAVAYTGAIDILWPRVVRKAHQAVGSLGWLDDATGAAPSGAAALVSYGATAEKILKARVSWASGNIDGGTIYMLRRRELLTA